MPLNSCSWGGKGSKNSICGGIWGCYRRGEVMQLGEKSLHLQKYYSCSKLRSWMILGLVLGICLPWAQAWPSSPAVHFPSLLLNKHCFFLPPPRSHAAISAFLPPFYIWTYALGAFPITWLLQPTAYLFPPLTTERHSSKGKLKISMKQVPKWVRSNVPFF